MIEIDSREIYLIETCQKLNILIKVCTLNVGDVCINNQVVIERKTIADLRASITDGRYYEQKSRLAKLDSPIKVLYLLEGIYDEKDKAITGAIASISLEFSLLMTPNILASAIIIKKMQIRLDEQKIAPNQTEATALSSCKKVHDNDSCSLALFLQLPNCGLVKANLLLRQFGNFTAFIDQLRTDHKVISNLVTSSQRKIGQASVDTWRQILSIAKNET